MRLLGLLLLASLWVAHVWAACASPHGQQPALKWQGGGEQVCNLNTWTGLVGTTSSTTCATPGMREGFSDGYVYICNGSHWINYATGTSKGACAIPHRVDFANGHYRTCNGSQLVPWCMSTEGTLVANGAAFGFGPNDKGQLGNGGTAPWADATQVVSTTAISFTQVTEGTQHTCGVDVDGKAYCWRLSSSGQLGYGGTTQQNYPVRVVSSTAISFTHVAGGNVFTCGLDKNSKAYCWGSSSNGQLGYGGASQQNKPVQVVSTTAISFAQVAAGANSAVAVDINGNAYYWGINDSGQAGIGVSNSQQLYPVKVISSTAISFTQISTGTASTCAIDTNNQAYCWSYGADGELGYGGLAQQIYPVKVVSTTAISFTQVTSGQSFNCGIDASGRAYCWGYGASYQMGNGDNSNQKWPVQVISATTISYTQIAAGSVTACAIDASGKTYCWGEAYNGELGVAYQTGTATPALVISTSTIPYAQLSVGGFGGCSVDTNGAAYCWGYNQYGQIGNGTSAPSDEDFPVRVVSTTAISFTQVATGGDTACGVDINNKAYCWGYGNGGRLGYGVSGVNQSYPVQVISSTAISFTQVVQGRGGQPVLLTSMAALIAGVSAPMASSALAILQTSTLRSF
ncbi:hypothetical protein [Bradyrhizobium sp. 33ap4]|uniref:RCC1 domain-containing protein n=1 Tax=Bradyrhizobium sp. 33ap4 TaxID=3061630 RepID=UPI002930478E|nr:hypothetical protein [Bradyrhizobium sp. 33ap4]